MGVFNPKNMTESKITIQGKEYPVVVNMQTILNFEEITGSSFFTEQFGTTKSRIAIILAAALAADEKSELTVETLKGEGNLQDVLSLIAAYTVVMELIEKFFKIPDVEKKKQEAEKKEGEDDPKNA